MARIGEGFGRGRAGGARGGEGEEVGGEHGEDGEEGGVGCGSCGGGSVCGGEACDTELGGFLSLQMSGRSVNWIMQFGLPLLDAKSRCRRRRS